MYETQSITAEHESVVIRRLRPDDLEDVIRIDAKVTGRRRVEYFKLKLQMALNETGIEVSLAAELDGLFVGFAIARVYYGDFGIAEPAAFLEAIGGHPDFRGLGVGHALLGQLATNLTALGVDTLSTEVAWEDPHMLAFAQREGFLPAPRFCLDLSCRSFRARDETRT